MEKSNFKIGVIGIKDDVDLFNIFGMDTFIVNTSDEAIKKLFELTSEKITFNKEEVCKYGIIFITENFAKNITDKENHKLQNLYLPAVIPIPSQIENKGFGLTNLGKIVERAVGINILK